MDSRQLLKIMLSLLLFCDYAIQVLLANAAQVPVGLHLLVGVAALTSSCLTLVLQRAIHVMYSMHADTHVCSRNASWCGVATGGGHVPIDEIDHVHEATHNVLKTIVL